MNVEFQQNIALIKSMSELDIARKQEVTKKMFIGYPIIKNTDGYPYSLFPLTDFSRPVNPSEIGDLADLVVYQGNFINVNMIVSEADRGGGPLTQAVAERTGLPFVLANWYKQEMPGYVTATASVGFSGNGLICVGGLEPGKHVVLIDDLLSTGGTIVALIKAIEKSGCFIDDIIVIGEKVNMKGREKIQAVGYDVKSLIRFQSVDNFTEEVL